MDQITHFTQTSLKQNVPQVRPGDTVRVHQKIREGNKERIQVFEGLVISTRGGNTISSSYTVRRVASNGIGVEKTFPLHSPNVVKVERLRSSKVRRAKLFYMRERFGRLARMKNETKDLGTWEDIAAQAEALEVEPEIPAEDTEVEIVTDEAPVEESTEEPAEEVTEAPAEESEPPTEPTEEESAS